MDNRSQFKTEMDFSQDVDVKPQLSNGPMNNTNGSVSDKKGTLCSNDSLFKKNLICN